jgi:periplasmic protein TonB
MGVDGAPYTVHLSGLPTPSVGPLRRKILIAASVVLVHAFALWALQAGLLRRHDEIVVPVAISGHLITQPAPKVEPPAAPPPPKRPPPVAKPAVPRNAARTQAPPTPRPPPVKDTLPLQDAARPAVTAPPADATTSTVAAAPTEPSAAPGPPSPPSPKVELPSTDASYLQNPAPVYPPLSKRLGEQGRVVVRVLIGADGVPQKADLKRSSGFERLDRSALEYVMRCRYVPGKVGGVPQAMWYEAPVSFVLE